MSVRDSLISLRFDFYELGIRLQERREHAFIVSDDDIVEMGCCDIPGPPNFFSGQRSLISNEREHEKANTLDPSFQNKQIWS